MASPGVALDHLVVAAETLDVGVAWVRSRLGVVVPSGGAHDHMATHNCVGRMGENIYLEIIAIDPQAKPDRTRWFSMDEPAFRKRLDTEGAFLHHWAINCSDIEASLAASTHAPGPAIAMSRGDLRWKIAVRDDGVLPRNGILPTMIEWPDAVHPANRMTDLGIHFEKLVITTTDVTGTTGDLAAMGATELCDVEEGDRDVLRAIFSRNGRSLTL